MLASAENDLLELDYSMKDKVNGKIMESLESFANLK